MIRCGHSFTNLKRTCSGLFSTLNPTGSKRSDFSLGTWNARSLFCADFPKLKRKVKLLSKHLRSRDIFCVQESRGNWANILKHLRLLMRDFWVFASFGEGYGGIITFVSKQFCPSECAILESVFIPGRAHKISIKGGDSCLVVYNIHNFDLQGLSRDNLCKAIDEDITYSSANPLSYTTFFAGDFNETPNGCKLFEYGQPSTYPESTSSPAAPRQQSCKLMKTISRATEITSSTPTRYQKHADAGVVLDRFFCTLLPATLILMKVNHTVEQEPKQLFYSGISDHAPVGITFLFKAILPRTEGPIPTEITRHFMFKYYVSHLLWEERFDTLHFETPFERLDFLKNIIKAGAILTREYLQSQEPDSPLIVSQTLASIARTVWTQSLSLFETLHKNSSLAREHIVLRDDGFIYIHDPGVFSAATDAANTALLAERAEAVTAQGKNKSENWGKISLKKISNLAKLWIPLAKSMILAAVKLDEKIIRSEPELTIAMGASWQPTFDEKPFNETEAREFLKEVGDIGKYDGNTQPPSEWDFANTIWTMKDSQPGGDDIPYSGYRATGPHGVKALVGCDRALRQGVSPPPVFNESNALFIPKGSQPHDPVEVIRTPLQTRPISMKNTDNKLIVATNVRALEPQYQQLTHWCQNGFCKGRNFLNNLLDIDSAARIYSMNYNSECKNSNPSNIPAIFSSDFEAAFPSMLQKWLWLVLEHRGLPQDYIRLFQGVYHRACAVFKHNGIKYVIIMFLSGVLQGCPGSAFLFNNGMDPFLEVMHRSLRSANKGIVRACADDVGTVLSRLKHLLVVAPVFKKAALLAGLNLKAIKCVLVPLCQFSDKVAQDIKKWLKRNIPEWSEFSIASCTNMLGLYIGPGAGTLNWTKQITKIKDRVKAIQSSSAPIRLNVLTFNSRVVPVASYVAQLLPPPPPPDAG